MNSSSKNPAAAFMYCQKIGKSSNIFSHPCLHCFQTPTEKRQKKMGPPNGLMPEPELHDLSAWQPRLGD